VHDLDSAARERWILCEHCLLWYHESCVYYTKGRSLPSRWFCGCMKQPECIWSCDEDIHTSIHFGFLGLYTKPVTCFPTSRILLPLCYVLSSIFLSAIFLLQRKPNTERKIHINYINVTIYKRFQNCIPLTNKYKQYHLTSLFSISFSLPVQERRF